MLKLALYKGPPAGRVRKVTHWLTCKVTGDNYSHCELVIAGISYSASAIDGGIRAKQIQHDPTRWDFIDLPGTEQDAANALAWFAANMGAPYDWAGLWGFVLPWRTENRKKFFCSEAVASALGIEKPWRVSPGDLSDLFTQPGESAPSLN